MKEIVSTEYGSPDVLQIKEAEKPGPEDNEVLIRVYATTVTPSDGLMRKKVHQSLVTRNTNKSLPVRNQELFHCSVRL